MLSLKNKTAIVTGSTRGIGRQIAETFATAGANLIITGRSQEQAEKVAAEITAKYGISAQGIGADVSVFSEAERVIQAAITAFGKLDILVNNAGITKDELLIRMTPEDWSAVIQINLNSVFNCTKSALRPMLKNKGGKIINIASVVGVIGNAGQSNYAASKAGIIGFTKSIAKEYAKKGLLCNVIAPGFVETDMIGSLPQDYLDTIIGQIPLQRLGQVDDIANTALFLASDLANYTTGQVLCVDGGMAM